MIQTWRENEVKKALEEYQLRPVQISDGVERGWSEFEDEEQTHQEVSGVDQGKTHFVGDDCEGGHNPVDEPGWETAR